MPLKARLDQIQRKANSTMDAAGTAIGAAHALIDELADGVNVKLIRQGDASIMDFILGKVTELPLVLRIQPKESDDSPRE